MRKEELMKREEERPVILERMKNRKRNWKGYWLLEDCILRGAIESLVERGKRKKTLSS